MQDFLAVGITVGDRPSEDGCRPPHQVPPAYRPSKNPLFSRSFSWVMVTAVGAVGIFLGLYLWAPDRATCILLPGHYRCTWPATTSTLTRMPADVAPAAAYGSTSPMTYAALPWLAAWSCLINPGGSIICLCQMWCSSHRIALQLPLRQIRLERGGGKWFGLPYKRDVGNLSGSAQKPRATTEGSNHEEEGAHREDRKES